MSVLASYKEELEGKVIELFEDIEEYMGESEEVELREELEEIKQDIKHFNKQNPNNKINISILNN